MIPKPQKWQKASRMANTEPQSIPARLQGHPRATPKAATVFACEAGGPKNIQARPATLEQRWREAVWGALAHGATAEADGCDECELQQFLGYRRQHKHCLHRLLHHPHSHSPPGPSQHRLFWDCTLTHRQPKDRICAVVPRSYTRGFCLLHSLPAEAPS